jgi:hypothetical protein
MASAKGEAGPQEAHQMDPQWQKLERLALTPAPTSTRTRDGVLHEPIADAETPPDEQVELFAAKQQG